MYMNLGKHMHVKKEILIYMMTEDTSGFVRLYQYTCSGIRQ